MAIGENKMEEKWQEVVSNFYVVFKSKIEKKIILMVVQNGANQNAACLHLQIMLKAL